MRTLYTAVGRLEIRSDSGGNRCPVIIVSGKEHMMSIREMLIWTCLAWRILNISQVETLYCRMAQEAGIEGGGDIKPHLNRLIHRGLAAAGAGETDGDALHDLLCDLYIIPAQSSIRVKAVVLFKAVLTRGMSFGCALRLLFPPKLSEGEKKMLRLVSQACLSASELIACVEAGADDLSTDEKVLDAIYADDVTTCDNIGWYARLFGAWKPALTDVANLYLRKLILFERIA